MLVHSLPSPDHELPPEPRRQRSRGVVWQPHYAGFTTIAYRDGRAIAGISGPWSNQYVLTWWHSSTPERRVDLFETLEQAKAAVAADSAAKSARWTEVFDALCREPVFVARPAWFTRFFERRARAARPQRKRRVEDTDLSGLNLRAER